MTALSKEVITPSMFTTKNHASPTFVALAKTISDKVLRPTSVTAQKTKQSLVNTSNDQTKLSINTSGYHMIPKCIPDAPALQAPTTPKKHCIPITIRIQTDTNKEKTFDQRRIITAVLHAFQAVHAEASICSIPNKAGTTQTQYIANSIDIPTDSTKLKVFNETLQNSPKEKICARIL
jgi:hypothetical protein